MFNVLKLHQILLSVAESANLSPPVFPTGCRKVMFSQMYVHSGGGGGYSITGVPQQGLGYPLARSGWGIPRTGVPPPQVRTGVPPGQDWGTPCSPCQDWGNPPARTGVPTPRDRTAEQVLAMRRAVCPLHSHGRTFLFHFNLRHDEMF